MLTPHRDGTRLLFPRSELDAYLEGASRPRADPCELTSRTSWGLETQNHAAADQLI